MAAWPCISAIKRPGNSCPRTGGRRTESRRAIFCAWSTPSVIASKTQSVNTWRLFTSRETKHPLTWQAPTRGLYNLENQPSRTKERLEELEKKQRPNNQSSPLRARLLTLATCLGKAFDGFISLALRALISATSRANPASFFFAFRSCLLLPRARGPWFVPGVLSSQVFQIHSRERSGMMARAFCRFINYASFGGGGWLSFVSLHERSSRAMPPLLARQWRGWPGPSLRRQPTATACLQDRKSVV